MATKAKTNGPTETVEQVISASQDAWKDGIEKAVQGYDELTAQSKGNVDAIIESVTISAKGAEALNTEAAEYSKKAFEDGVAVAQAAAGVKGVQELIELNTEYTKSAFEAYMGAATRMSELWMATAKDATAPITARVSATVEAAQNVSVK